jgi:hypothetical protein
VISRTNPNKETPVPETPVPKPRKRALFASVQMRDIFYEIYSGDLKGQRITSRWLREIHGPWALKSARALVARSLVRHIKTSDAWILTAKGAKIGA